MTKILNVGKWLTKRKLFIVEHNAKREALCIEEFKVEGIVFDLMPLNDELIEDLQSCLTYQEMLFFAAEYGVVVEYERAAEDSGLALALESLWGEEELSIDQDPCIRQRVGDKVCEISGLSSYIKEMLDTEEDAKEAAIMAKELEDEAVIAIDGDKPLPDESIEDLKADAELYAKNNNM